MSPSSIRLTLLLAIPLVALGCHHEPKLDVQASAGTPAVSDAAAPAGAEPAPVSGHASAPPLAPDATLPPGHPSLDGPTQAAGPLPAGHPALGAASPALPPGHPALPANGTQPMAGMVVPGGQGEQALAWKTPQGWISEPPANEMRRAQYQVPGADGAAECDVFYFGPGQGGDPQANAARWAAQFTNPDGSAATSALKTRASEAAGMKVLMVETRGTYMAGSMAGGAVEKKPGYALLGAIVEGPDANWFFKLTGPEATVTAQRAAFESMIGSMKKGG